LEECVETSRRPERQKTDAFKVIKKNLLEWISQRMNVGKLFWLLGSLGVSSPFLGGLIVLVFFLLLFYF